MAVIGDLISAVVASAADVAADNDTLAAANAKLLSDSAKQTANKTALGSAVAQTGGVFSVNPDGSATAYEPDGAGGYVPKVLQPATTPVPDAASAGVPISIPGSA